MLRHVPKFSHGTQWIMGEKIKWGVSKNGTPIA
jgi:hypothetical protein